MATSTVTDLTTSFSEPLAQADRKTQDQRPVRSTLCSGRQISVAAGSTDIAFSQQDFTVLGNRRRGDRLGHAIASGDFNGDGLDDILIGAPLADGPEDAVNGIGEAYVILGSPNLGGTLDLFSSSPSMTV